MIKLGDRMKTYEAVSDISLVKRTPVIIRLDGRAFHTFTRGLEKPFSDLFINSMKETTKYLMKNVQNAVLGYVQSDEISLLLIDYKNINTEPYFANRIQKLTSITASMATLAFNLEFDKQLDMYLARNSMSQNDRDRLMKKKYTAMFDSRVFNIPSNDVTNYFIWRQKDAIRNSVNGLAQSCVPHKQLQGLKQNDVLELLKSIKNPHSDLPIHKQRGISFYVDDENDLIEDLNMPIFTENRNYIENLLLTDEEKYEIKQKELEIESNYLTVDEIYKFVIDFLSKYKAVSEDMVQELVTFVWNKRTFYDKERGKVSTFVYNALKNEYYRIYNENKRKFEVNNPFSLDSIASDEEDVAFLDIMPSDEDIEGTVIKEEIFKSIEHLLLMETKYYIMYDVPQKTIAKKLNTSSSVISRRIIKNLEDIRKYCKLNKIELY